MNHFSRRLAAKPFAKNRFPTGHFALAIFLLVCVPPAVAPANLISFTSSVLSSPTLEAGGTLSLPRFPTDNPSLTLTQILVDAHYTANGTATASLAAQHPGPDSFFSPLFIGHFNIGDTVNFLTNSEPGGANVLHVTATGPVSGPYSIDDTAINVLNPSYMNANLLGSGTFAVPVSLTGGVSAGTQHGDIFNQNSFSNQTLTTSLTVFYTYTAVPEPAAVSLLALAAASLLIRRKRIASA